MAGSRPCSGGGPEAGTSSVAGAATSSHEPGEERLRSCANEGPQTGLPQRHGDPASERACVKWGRGRYQLRLEEEVGSGMEGPGMPRWGVWVLLSPAGVMVCGPGGDTLRVGFRKTRLVRVGVDWQVGV